MATRPTGYGLTAETKRKIDSKFDADLANQALNWVEAVLEENLFDDRDEANLKKYVQDQLKDGTILCRVINKLSPGSVKKVNASKMAFKMMENIGNFLQGCYNYGVKKEDLFQTADLYEGANIVQVVNGLAALARKAQSSGYDGPSFGPKESTAAPREFTQEQLEAGKSIIGLQMGSNKGASQAGQNFGKTRQILD
ncbi:myophilin-like [Rhopilema esculentum]|uniref:myophilin-like n=1 Tax=Rhopilema esculentum TaxID=499914 RepID=UPI0031E3AA26|eukprot:gene11960-2536_t